MPMIARHRDNENLYLIYSDDLQYLGKGGQAISEAGISLGVRADRQLWIADSNSMKAGCC